MNKMQYQKYLKGEHWQNVKRRYYEKHTYKCVKCGWRRNLQLHHLHYRNVGREKLTDLIYLCRRCHMLEHGIGVKSHGRDIKHMWILWGVSFLLTVGWIYVAYMRE